MCDCCGRAQKGWYHRRKRLVHDLACGGFRIVLELEVRRVACRDCGSVKRERLDFLADNVHFTKRFAFYVGRRCGPSLGGLAHRDLWPSALTISRCARAIATAL